MDQIDGRPEESAAVADRARPESPTGLHAETLRRGLEWTKHLAPILQTVEEIFGADLTLAARQAEIETTTATLQRLHEEEAGLGEAIEVRLQGAEKEGRDRAAAIIGAAETEMAKQKQAADEELRRVQSEIGNANETLAALDAEAGGLRTRMAEEAAAHVAEETKAEADHAASVEDRKMELADLDRQIQEKQAIRDALAANIESIRREQRASAEAALRLLGSPDAPKETGHEG